MRKIFVALCALALATLACSLFTGTSVSVAPEQSAPPQQPEVLATEVPEAPAAPAQTANCSDNQTSSFSPRDPLIVDGVQTSIQFRDPNCFRAVFHTETGVGIGRNFKVVVPMGWSLGISAVSCAVQADGVAKQTDYTGGPFTMARGRVRLAVMKLVYMVFLPNGNKLSSSDKFFRFIGVKPINRPISRFTSRNLGPNCRT